ncbi:MAG: hypothetical protein RRZ24_10025, partial [Clostridia bacterium]
YENEYRIALTYVDSDLSWLTAVGNTFLADYGAKFISVNNYGSDANEDQYLRFDADMNLEKTVQEQIKDASCKLTLIK